MSHQRSARRTFLKSSLGMAGAVAFTWGTPAVQARGANERLTLGILGCSRGLVVGKEMAEQGVRVVSVYDPDAARVEKVSQHFQLKRAAKDLREVLDNKSIDAVLVATPDHWHAPASILSADAGKHVYVEKPCSHNIREGRLMVEAARRNKIVMHVGSQSRSTPVIQKPIQMIREGMIGDVLVAKAWNSQRRPNIGHVAPSKPPGGFDYDQWVGPAVWQPFRKNCYHYTWHWWYNFGTGDAGNDGVHELDIAVWGLGIDSHPSSVSGYGVKMYFDDDQQFPDTQYVTYDYPANGEPGQRRMLVYEQRIWSPYLQEGQENGNAFYGTKGMLILGKHDGWQLFGERNKLIAEEKGTYAIAPHVQEFIDAVKSGRRSNTDIEIGHRSATLIHLANIVARTGRPVRFDPTAEQILDNPEANALIRREYRDHWATPKGS